MTHFRKGDIVRLKNGHAPIIVLDTVLGQCCKNHQVRPCVSFRYLGSVRNDIKLYSYAYTELSAMRTLRRIEDFVHMYNHELDSEARGHIRDIDESGVLPFKITVHHVQIPGMNFTPEEETMAKLYQTNEKKPRYGTFLTTNSAGQYVLEMKGNSGDVEAFDKDFLEEVMPYTIALQPMTGGNGDNAFHIVCEEEQFKKGDVLIHEKNACMYRVVELNTKNRQPRQGYKTFYRIDTERVEIKTENP